jgi:hypothetical protein
MLRLPVVSVRWVDLITKEPDLMRFWSFAPLKSSANRLLDFALLLLELIEECLVLWIGYLQTDANALLLGVHRRGYCKAGSSYREVRPILWQRLLRSQNPAFRIDQVLKRCPVLQL